MGFYVSRWYHGAPGTCLALPVPLVFCGGQLLFTAHVKWWVLGWALSHAVNLLSEAIFTDWACFQRFPHRDILTLGHCLQLSSPWVLGLCPVRPSPPLGALRQLLEGSERTADGAAVLVPLGPPPLQALCRVLAGTFHVGCSLPPTNTSTGARRRDSVLRSEGAACSGSAVRHTLWAGHACIEEREPLSRVPLGALKCGPSTPRGLGLRPWLAVRTQAGAGGCAEAAGPSPHTCSPCTCRLLSVRLACARAPQALGQQSCCGALWARGLRGPRPLRVAADHGLSVFPPPAFLSPGFSV